MHTPQKLTLCLLILSLFNAFPLLAANRVKSLHDYISEQLTQAERGREITPYGKVFAENGESSYQMPGEFSFVSGEDVLTSDNLKMMSQLHEVLRRPSIIPALRHKKPPRAIPFPTADALQLASGSSHCPDCSLVNKITGNRGSAIGSYQLARLLMIPKVQVKALESRQILVSTLSDSLYRGDPVWAAMEKIKLREPYILDLMARDGAMFNDFFTQVIVRGGQAKYFRLLPYAENFLQALFWFYTIKNTYQAGSKIYYGFSLASLFTLATGGAVVKGIATHIASPLVLYGLQSTLIRKAANFYWEAPVRRYSERIKHLQNHVADAKTLFAKMKGLGIANLMEHGRILSSLDARESTLSCIIHDIELGEFKCMKAPQRIIPGLDKIDLLDRVRRSNEFVDFLRAAGEAEAWLHVAALTKQTVENRPAVYSLARFLDDDETTIHLKDFWNPLVGQKSSITNDFSVDGDSPRIFIVTGPNAGGKTTSINSIATSILMAQTLTVVPASQMSITPLSLLRTSDLHSGSSDLGLSSYESEISNASGFINDSARVEAESGKSFIFMDEPFKGTNCDSAAIATSGLLKNLAKQPHTVAMTTYHACSSKPNDNAMESPVWLAEHHPDTFANIQVKAVVEKRGTLNYDYKLHSGASEQTVGLQMIYSMDVVPQSLRDEISELRPDLK